jgi:hypothetical protein
MIKNEKEWLQKIQEAQKAYELERRAIEEQRRRVQLDVARLESHRQELLELQTQIATELGMVLTAKEEARTLQQTAQSPSAASPSSAPKEDDAAHKREKSDPIPEGDSSDDEVTPIATISDLSDDAMTIIPMATLVNSFPYRLLDKIGRKITHKTVIASKYCVRNADDMKAVQKQFSKLRCIRRFHIQSTPDAYRPQSFADSGSVKSDSSGRISALIFRKRITELRSILEKERKEIRQEAPEKEADYRTHVCVGFFITDALSDEEVGNPHAVSNVICAFRFKLQCETGESTQSHSKHLMELENLLSSWTKFAEKSFNEHLTKAKLNSDDQVPQFRCSLGRLPRGTDTKGIGYEILWRLDDSGIVPTPGVLKSDAVLRDERFRYLLNVLTAMMFQATTKILDAHSGKVDAKFEAARTELAEMGLNQDVAEKAKSVFAEVLALHNKLSRLYATASHRAHAEQEEVVLLHRKVYLLMSCLAHHKAFVELSGTVSWDTNIVQSPQATGKKQLRSTAFDVSDMLRVMSPKSGERTSDAAIRNWNESGAKIFENVTEFLTPVLRYFQVDDPKYPKGAIYRAAHVQLNVANVPHAILNSIHKMVEYRKEGIVLYRTVVDEMTGAQQKIRGRVQSSSSVLSTKSKVSLGLTFFDELHFDVRRPRPADQQNGIDNDSLIELQVSQRLEEMEAKTKETLRELRSKIEAETSGGGARIEKAKQLIDEAAATANELLDETKEDLTEWAKLSEALHKWSQAEPKMVCTAMRLVVPFLAPASVDGVYQPPPRYLNLRWSLDDLSKKPGA